MFVVSPNWSYLKMVSVKEGLSSAVYWTKGTESFRKKSSDIRHLEESQEDSQIPGKENEWPFFNFRK